MIVMCKSCENKTQPHIDSQQLLRLLMGQTATIHFECPTCGKMELLEVEMLVDGFTCRPCLREVDRDEK